MANRAPSIDPVLAALEAAPFVPTTPAEARLLAEAEAFNAAHERADDRSHDDVVARVKTNFAK